MEPKGRLYYYISPTRLSGWLVGDAEVENAQGKVSLHQLQVLSSTVWRVGRFRVMEFDFLAFGFVDKAQSLPLKMWVQDLEIQVQSSVQPFRAARTKCCRPSGTSPSL